MTAPHSPQGFSTRAIHVGQDPDPVTGAVMPPVVLSTTYAQNAPGETKAGYDYTRAGNPNRDALEAVLASLEGGARAICFGSGCAAMTALFQTLRPGDHVVASEDVYGGTYRILEQVMAPMGVETTWMDFTQVTPGNTDALEAALRPNTKIVLIETPSNPLLKLVDIAAVASVTKARGIVLAADNTFATPYLQRPLDLGVDVVVHSVTKYLNGHSDVLGGALVVKDPELGEKLHFIQKAIGAVPSPMDCYTVARGLKTLAVRMERHCSTTASLAQWLQQHPKITHVNYPGLQSHPQHALAQQQMQSPRGTPLAGGMVSFVVDGGTPAVTRVLQAVRVFTLAESLGGVESLICHPATMTHATIPKEVRQANGISDGLIRASVGLEDLQDLQTDLDLALNA